MCLFWFFSCEMGVHGCSVFCACLRSHSYEMNDVRVGAVGIGRGGKWPTRPASGRFLGEACRLIHCARSSHFAVPRKRFRPGRAGRSLKRACAGHHRRPSGAASLRLFRRASPVGCLDAPGLPRRRGVVSTGECDTQGQANGSLAHLVRLPRPLPRLRRQPDGSGALPSELRGTRAARAPVHLCQADGRLADLLPLGVGAPAIHPAWRTVCPEPVHGRYAAQLSEARRRGADCARLDRAPRRHRLAGRSASGGGARFFGQARHRPW
jgi:hypothetical protein